MDSLTFYEQLARDFGDLHKKLKKHESAMLNSFGISYMEYHILSYIFKNGTASQNDLASHLDVDKALISRYIQLLENKGLIICEEDPGCRRKNILSLSDKALETVPRLSNVHSEELERLFSEIDKSQLESLDTLLKGLVSRL